MLGTVKITFNILTRIQDYVRNTEPQLKETPEDKIDRLEKELMKLKLVNKINVKTKKEENDSQSEYDGDDEFIEELKEH
jgi:hypothetical protein